MVAFAVKSEVGNKNVEAARLKGSIINELAS